MFGDQTGKFSSAPIYLNYDKHLCYVSGETDNWIILAMYSWDNNDLHGGMF